MSFGRNASRAAEWKSRERRREIRRRESRRFVPAGIRCPATDESARRKGWRGEPRAGLHDDVGHDAVSAEDACGLVDDVDEEDFAVPIAFAEMHWGGKRLLGEECSALDRTRRRGGGCRSGRRVELGSGRQAGLSSTLQGMSQTKRYSRFSHWRISSRPTPDFRSAKIKGRVPRINCESRAITTSRRRRGARGRFY